VASGDNKEHKMLFDIRGRRRNAVKVVYAVLALLMGGSLFLTVGGFNIAELFNNNSASGEAAETYEEQTERIEAKLKKDPENPALLVSLTRAQINTGNAHVTEETPGQRSYPPEAVQGYQQAYQTWSDYLETTDEPNSSLALLMGPMLFQLAELSRSYPEASTRIKSATEAQEIVAEQRPSLNAFTVLASYAYFTGDTAAAEKARSEAKKLAGSKAERKAIDEQLNQFKASAENFLKEKAKTEKAEKEGRAGGAGGEAAPGGLENPLGGGLSGGLTE
jgi:hypothetical protein